MNLRANELRCPNCAALVERPEDSNARLACRYCGAELVLEPEAQQEPAQDATLAQPAADGAQLVAAELAIQRLERELETLRMQRESRSSSSLGCLPPAVFASILLVPLGIVLLNVAEGHFFIYGLGMIAIAGVLLAIAFAQRAVARASAAQLDPRITELEARIAEKKRVADG